MRVRVEVRVKVGVRVGRGQDQGVRVRIRVRVPVRVRSAAPQSAEEARVVAGRGSTPGYQLFFCTLPLPCEPEAIGVHLGLGIGNIIIY